MMSLTMRSVMEKGMKEMMEEVISRSVRWCGEKYDFDVEEALRELRVEVCLSSSLSSESKLKGKKELKGKRSIPLPYNGEKHEERCKALRANSGLYTQCEVIVEGESRYCKTCFSQMEKKGLEKPEYGTIEDRLAVGIFEYVDPKGRKPVSFTKIMKKLNLTKEQVLEEAKMQNMEIDEGHFEERETDTKRGRPSSKEKEEKPKGPKGRPKKTKKVIEVEGNDDDLFAALVAEANSVEDVEVVSEVVSVEEEDSKKEMDKKMKEEQRLKEKEAKKEAERQEREAKKAAAEAAKAEKKAAAEAAKAEKEAAKAAAKAAKDAEKAAKDAEKAAKDAEKAAAKAAKKSTSEKPTASEDEPDVVKKIEFEGKKYLKSKKTGIVYDYEEYVKNNDQVVVGKWNDQENKIEFKVIDEEEEEEEYDE